MPIFLAVLKLEFSGVSNFIYWNRCAKFQQNLRGSPSDPLLSWHGMTYKYPDGLFIVEPGKYSFGFDPFGFSIQKYLLTFKLAFVMN